LNLGRATPVGIFPDGASSEEVLDLSGNIWEWCSDWYADDTYARRSGYIKFNPTGPPEGHKKILRGGAHYSNRHSVRCAYRFWDFPSYWDSGDGFRVARSYLSKAS